MRLRIEGVKENNGYDAPLILHLQHCLIFVYTSIIIAINYYFSKLPSTYPAIAARPSPFNIPPIRVTPVHS
ncbi:hypothetical protein E2C01_066207 [Portunus trituberculatus]|uniref:Uncharacterized protein n=1 Tax=Portunus trituberculatus TaxID=210409 RepID=A0A5B7HQE5_PORTR|nr:hypothetical protein [Portunus trituberculatus]